MKGKGGWGFLRKKKAAATAAHSAPAATAAPDLSGVDNELAAALGVAPKKKLSGKTLLLAGGGALALGGLIFGGVKLLGNSGAQETVYREYTVERGDITVGQSESSSISLNRETVEFPVSTTVEEIYVKEGSSVKTGDPLMKLNVADIKLSLTSFELEVEMAELELEKAKLDQQSKLLAAEQKLETTTLAGELADVKQHNTNTELAQALASAETALAEAKEKYENYCLINTTFDADYLTLKNYENDVEQLEDALANYKTLQTSAKSADDAETALTKALTSLESALEMYINFGGGSVDSDGNTVEEALEECCAAIRSGTLDVRSLLKSTIGELDKNDYAMSVASAWNSYTEAYTTYSYYANAGGYTYAELTAMVASLTLRLNSAEAQYDSFYEYYKNVYGDIEDAEDMADAVTDAELAVDKAKLALSTQEVTSSEKTVAAEQSAATAANDAEVASSTYELTQMELSQAVESAQEEYDTALKQLDEVKALIEDDGVVKAPCNGMIATLSVEEGDDLDVFIDEDTHTIMMYATLLTMTDISNVYVPITISEEDILSVYIGQSASVSMTAFSGRDFAAEVDAITIESARSGAATVSYTVNVRFSEENTLDMYEGMSAEVTLVQRAAEDVLYVSNQAVTNLAGVATVLKKVGEETVETVVTTGFSDGRYVEILSGLAEGDVVLAESAVSRS